MQSVLFLAHNVYPTDGWGRVTRQLSLLMKSRGYNIHYETCKSKQNPPSFLKSIPIYYTISSSIGSIKSLALDLFNSILHIRRYRSYDLIVAADETVLFSAFCRSLISRTKFVCIFHGTYGPLLLNSRQSIFFRLSAFYAYHLYFVSEYTKNKVFPFLYSRQYQFSILPLGVTPPNSSPLPSQSRQNQILTVGEIKPRKGIEQTILALANLPVSQRPIYYVAGKFSEDTPYYKRLTRLIYSYKLQSSVKFLGCVSDAELIELYRTSKILVLPSQDIDNHFEGFGLVHLEAHSHGTPAIGSVHSGNHEVIHHGNDGYLLKDNSIEELSVYISNLCFDDSLWSKFSINAYNNSLSRSWEFTIDCFLSSLHPLEI